MRALGELTDAEFMDQVRLARGTGDFPQLPASDDLSGLVHDLRSPLATIGHELALLERNASPTSARSFAAIRANLHYLERLIAEVATPVAATSTPLAAIVEGVIARLPKAQFQRVELDVRAQSLVIVDRTGIERVVANLLDNALKYTCATLPILVRIEQVDHTARVSVIDQGHGMTASVAARIFDRHVSYGSDHGTGLGLSVAREIIEAHGGRIGVATAPGRGSCFHFELEGAIDVPPTSAGKRLRGTSSVLCGASVLLVDDNAAQLYALAELLRGELVAVATATSAPECLIRAQTQRPEVIVLDVHLDGTDVSVLARNLLAIDARMPIIVSTGLPRNHAAVQRALDATNGVFLPKPFELDQLCVLLERALVGTRRLT